MKRIFKVEVHLSRSPKYSGVFELFADDAGWKVVNNIKYNTSIAEAPYFKEATSLDVKKEILPLEKGEWTIFWCEDETGDYVRVEAL